MSSFLTPPLQSHSIEGLSVHHGLESSFGIHLNPLELSFSTFKVGLGVGPVSDTLQGFHLWDSSTIRDFPLVWLEPSPFHKGTTPEMLTETLSRRGGKFFCSLRTFWVRQEPLEAKEEAPSVYLPLVTSRFLALLQNLPARDLPIPWEPLAQLLLQGAHTGLRCSRNRKH